MRSAFETDDWIWRVGLSVFELEEMDCGLDKLLCSVEEIEFQLMGSGTSRITNRSKAEGGISASFD